MSEEVIQTCKTCNRKFLESDNFEFNCVVPHKGELSENISLTCIYLGCRCCVGVYRAFHRETDLGFASGNAEIHIKYNKRDWCWVGKHNSQRSECFHSKCTDEEFNKFSKIKRVYDYDLEMKFLKEEESRRRQDLPPKTSSLHDPE